MNQILSRIIIRSTRGAEYLRKEVRLQALKVSGKDQSPQLLASPDLSPEWTQWTVR